MARSFLPKFSSRSEKRLLALCKNNSDEDDEVKKWNRTAVQYLIKLLKRNPDIIIELEKAVSLECSATKCVPVPKNPDNRLLISHRRGLPQVIYCRLWRWPDLQSHHQIEAIPTCEISAGQQRSQIVCVNPYHYDRKKPGVILPVFVPCPRIPPDLSTSYEDSEPRVGTKAIPNRIAVATVRSLLSSNQLTVQGNTTRPIMDVQQENSDRVPDTDEIYMSLERDQELLQQEDGLDFNLMQNMMPVESTPQEFEQIFLTEHQTQLQPLQSQQEQVQGQHEPNQSQQQPIQMQPHHQTAQTLHHSLQSQQTSVHHTHQEQQPQTIASLPEQQATPLVQHVSQASHQTQQFHPSQSQQFQQSKQQFQQPLQHQLYQQPQHYQMDTTLQDQYVANPQCLHQQHYHQPQQPQHFSPTYQSPRQGTILRQAISNKTEIAHPFQFKRNTFCQVHDIRSNAADGTDQTQIFRPQSYTTQFALPQPTQVQQPMVQNQYQNYGSMYSSHYPETQQDHAPGVQSEMQSPYFDQIAGTSRPIDQSAPISIDFAEVRFAEGKNWCSISYHEFGQRVGEKYKPNSYTISVDGYTHPRCSNRFCLGGLSNVNRNETTEWARRRIGKGVKLTYVDGEVYVECLCEASIFVASPMMFLGDSGDGTSEGVMKVVEGSSVKVFSTPQFSKLLSDAVPKGFEAVYKLTNYCTFRISFVKGWGKNYKRQTILSTPCWVEVQLNGPLQWIDKVLRQMRPPQGCGSTS